MVFCAVTNTIAWMGISISVVLDDCEVAPTKLFSIFMFIISLTMLFTIVGVV